MQLPCSMPLSEPWSPVGYQVVQLPEVEVALGKPPQPSQASALPASALPEPRRPALPRSPLGYRVTLVREDRLPPAPPRKAEGQPLPRRAGQHAGQRPRPRSNGMAIWLPLIVVAAVAVPVTLATTLASAHRARQPQPAQVVNGGLIVCGPDNAPVEPAPGAGVNAAPGDGCIPCAQAQAHAVAALPPDRAYHGTALHFARNPVEAARIAHEERKLTFVLHVSGNFDDPGFTWNNAEALRRSALVQPDVGAYLNRHYIPAFQKVATFRKIGNAKVGGNVASYFCTADGLVLHLVAGPVNGRVLLNEARWANETYEMARLENKTAPAELRAFFRRAHVARLQNEHGAWQARAEQLPEIAEPTAEAIDTSLNRYERWNNAAKVHLMLASAPLPPIELVYQPVFERLLNERISTNPVATR